MNHWRMKCPQCGDDHKLDVVVTVWAHVTYDGTEPEGDHEWDGQSPCRCRMCDWQGLAKDAGA